MLHATKTRSPSIASSFPNKKERKFARKRGGEEEMGGGVGRWGVGWGGGWWGGEGVEEDGV